MDLPYANYDKDVLLATIIRNYSSLPALYEDPEEFYDEMEYWWKSHKNNYLRMFKVMDQDYEALENYNRMESRNHSGTNSSTLNGNDTTNHTGDDTHITKNEGKDIISHDGDNTETHTGTDTIKNTGTDKVHTDMTNTNTPGVTDTTESKVSSFNESAYQPSNQVTESHEGSNTDHNEGDVSTTHGLTTSNTHGENIKTELNSSDTTEYGSTVTLTDKFGSTDSITRFQNNSSTDKFEESAHLHGNIGVTKSQEMLMDEIEVRLRNIYGIIAKQFSDEMLLSIW